MEINNVLVTAGYDGADWLRLEEGLGPARIVRVEHADAKAVEAALAQVDVAIIRGDLDERFLNREQLKWVHCDHAGIEKSARPEVFESGLLVSGSSGRSAPALAEHAIMFMINLCYQFPRFLGFSDFRLLVDRRVNSFGSRHPLANLPEDRRELTHRIKHAGKQNVHRQQLSNRHWFSGKLDAENRVS